MSLREQICQYVDTKLLVLGHGAGMVHMLWMPAGGTVIEIIPKGKAHQISVPYFTQRLGLSYKRIWVDKAVCTISYGDLELALNEK